MGRASQAKAKGTYDQGREDQFREMMQQLASLQSKYKGVRGELLAKVKAELAKLKPVRATLSVVAPAAEQPPAAPLPSCRVCGRGMRLNGTDGSLICQNGHVRLF